MYLSQNCKISPLEWYGTLIIWNTTGDIFLYLNFGTYKISGISMGKTFNFKKFTFQQFLFGTPTGCSKKIILSKMGEVRIF